MVLYDYQTKLLEDLQGSIAAGFKRICCVSPTGSGKTIMIREFVRRLENNYKTCFLLPSKVLLKQSIDAYRSIGLRFGKLHGENKFSEVVQNWLSTVQTLTLRVSQYDINFDFFIIDECHHVRSSTYTRLMSTLFPNAFFIGFTATPVRSDNLGLGAWVDGFRSFEKIVFGPSVKDLIAANRLSDYVIMRPRNPILDPIAQQALKDHKYDTIDEAISSGAIIGDMISLFKQHARNDRGLIFARNIDQSRYFAEKYREAGLKIAHLDGSMSKTQIDRIVEDYRNSRLQAITSCNMISEGFDVPACRVVQLGRYTESLALYCQQTGRGIRYEEGKEKAVIIDHAKNFARHGDMRWITNDDWHEMFLGENQDRNINVYECEICFSALESGQKICPDCGHNHGDAKVGQDKKHESDFKAVSPTMIDIEFEEVNSVLSNSKLSPDQAFKQYEADFMRCNSMHEVKTVLRLHGLQIGLSKLFYDKILDKKMEVFL